MAFKPAMAELLTRMDEASLQLRHMGLRAAMLRLTLEPHFAFNPEHGLFFADLQSLTVCSAPRT
jgi:hypothetical protein